MIRIPREAIIIPTGIYLLKVNERNTRARFDISSELTIKTPERRHWRRSGVFIVNFEHVSQIVLRFLLLTLTCNCRLECFMEIPQETKDILRATYTSGTH